MTFSHDSSHPYLILSRAGIEAHAYGVDQETLVNKVYSFSLLLSNNFFQNIIQIFLTGNSLLLQPSHISSRFKAKNK